MGRMRKPVIWLGALVAVAVAAVAAINLFVVLSTRSDVTTVAKAPHAQAAIVLGARVYGNGQMSPMLADRVTDAPGALPGRHGPPDHRLR